MAGFNKQTLSGLVFVGIGVLSAAIASRYSMGTSMRIGPGWFPLMVSLALAAMGAVITVKGLVEGGERPQRLPWRPFVVIPVSMMLFGVLLPRVGLVVSCIALVFCSALARQGQRLFEMALLSLGLAAFSVTVFVYGLRIPFRTWPF
jgi:hypothetical protein